MIDALQPKLENNEFRYVKYCDVPTILRMADRGVGGYRVPAKIVSRDLLHVKLLEEWVEKYREDFPKTELDEVRDIDVVRIYATWVKRNSNGNLSFSSNYRDDGPIALEFVKASEL